MLCPRPRYRNKGRKWELQVTEAGNAMYISCRNKTKRHTGGNITEIGCCRSYFFVVNYFFSADSGKKIQQLILLS